MHHRMARTVLHAPLAFFHTNPSGRVLNRFSKVYAIPL
jgi:ABC-type bacteriocin/lantibiotic exporter with double-glycine peptidase domain